MWRGGGFCSFELAESGLAPGYAGWQTNWFLPCICHNALSANVLRLNCEYAFYAFYAGKGQVVIDLG